MLLQFVKIQLKFIKHEINTVIMVVTFAVATNMILMNIQSQVS